MSGTSSTDAVEFFSKYFYDIWYYLNQDDIDVSESYYDVDFKRLDDSLSKIIASICRFKLLNVIESIGKYTLLDDYTIEVTTHTKKNL